MSHAMRLVSSLCLCLFVGPSVLGQVVELTDAGAPRFTDEIVRSIAVAKDAPLPANMDEGPRTIVYAFKRVDPKAMPMPTDDLRLPLHIRLIDTSREAKVLVDVAVKPFYGGKLEYSTEKIVNKLGNDQSPNTGTLITGKVEEGHGGKWSVNGREEALSSKPSCVSFRLVPR